MQRVLALGAAGGANHPAEGWDAQLSELSQASTLIVDRGGGGGFPTLTRLVSPGGRIVFFGAAAGNPAAIDLRNQGYPSGQREQTVNLPAQPS